MDYITATLSGDVIHPQLHVLGLGTRLLPDHGVKPENVTPITNLLLGYGDVTSITNLLLGYGDVEKKEK